MINAAGQKFLMSCSV